MAFLDLRHTSRMSEHKSIKLKLDSPFLTMTRLPDMSFPWRNIDDTNIETEGFIPETFEFTIDQARILDLLTGRTL